MLATMQRFLRDESGSSTVEYGVVISLAITAAVGVANEAGDQLEMLYRGINQVLDAVASAQTVARP